MRGKRLNIKPAAFGARLLLHVPLLLTGDETLEALAILAVAIGLAGLAILILFSRKKI